MAHQETPAREAQGQLMTMTDPIADMLTASAERELGVPRHCGDAVLARSRRHIAEILQQEGYITGWNVEDAEVGKNLVLELKFGPNRERSIAGIKRDLASPVSGVREVHQPAEGARRPGRGDHLHVPRAAHRQAGRQEGRGRGSPRLRLVTGRAEEAAMSRIGKLPISVPAGVDVTIDGRTVAVKGPKGALDPHRRGADRHRQGRGRHAARSPAPTTSVRPEALHGLSRTLVGEHDHRRDRRLQQDAGDQRCRLPRPGQGLEPGVRPRLQPPDPGRGPRGHRLQGRGARPSSRSRASTSRRSARSPPTSASCASLDPYKAKGVKYAGRGHPPQGRKGR